MRRSGHRLAMRVLATISVVTCGVASAGTAQAAPDVGAPTTAIARRGAVPPQPPEDRVDPQRRDSALTPRWRSSTDVAWTTSGDANGFHVFAAEAKTGYQWRTVTSLSEPGFEADMWIGNACLTGSGRRLVVVYAPRTFTNDGDLFDRGGFTAVVDISTGQVHKLPVLSTLAYFNPGCGAGERAVVTQLAGKRADGPTIGQAQTRLFAVDAVKARLSSPVVVPTEVTSAIPVGDAMVAAAAGGLVQVTTKGKTNRIAATSGVPFRLTPDASGGVVFLDRSGDRLRVRHTKPSAGARVRTLAVGSSAKLGVAAGTSGRVFLTGQADRVEKLPQGVRKVDVPRDSGMSSRGELALTRVAGPGSGDPRTVDTPLTEAQPVHITAKAVATASELSFRLLPEAIGQAAATGRAAHPKLGTWAAPRTGARAMAAGSPTSAVETERYCSVPRNDPRNQVLQPKPRQVEWAVDQAITDSLHITREANWKNLGMPQYSPQGLFPSVNLVGGGRVPAQVMLGIIAQESNMWQATSYALPGVTGNPLIGNFYGRDIYNGTEADDWDINWADADCGYGVAQITDGMRLAGKEKPGEKALDYQAQRAVALDFATNVAAGVRILQGKWNETRAAGLTVNNGNSSFIENWFFAVWAYNSGFYPDKSDGSPWGVGWANNPINPRYDQQRDAFLDKTYADARVPQKWPYPEKVMGWAGHPVTIAESPDKEVAGYTAAWWNSALSRTLVKPPLDLFCNQSNNCEPGGKYVPNAPDTAGEPTGPCKNKNAAGQYDLRCWYHKAVSWKGGPGQACDCGNENLRFDPGYEYQDDGTSFPPRCTLAGLPDNARVIDDVPDGTPAIRSNCGRPWTNAGTFGLKFASDENGLYPSKVDFHQLGGGFGGHFYFGFTHKEGDQGGEMKATGTWTINPTKSWTRVLVHIPDHAAYTRQANYKIYLPGETSPSKHRAIPTRWQAHTWLDLGVFDFRASGTPKVELSNVTQDGTGMHKIVWDAIAVQPLAAKPMHFVVAMGDSFSSGEGAGDYTRVSDQYGDDPTSKNSCRRNSHAWARQIVLDGTPSNESLGSLTDRRSVDVDFHHIACAGAQTHNVMATRTMDGQPAPRNATGNLPQDTSNGELTQLDQGFLDENTTLVVLTIGGNDAGWANVFAECAINSCLNPGFTLPGDDRPMAESVPDRLRNKIKPDVARVVREIRERAPSAWIVLAGYPQIFKSGTSYSSNIVDTFAVGLTHDEVDWINEMTRIAATETFYLDLAYRVNSVDVRSEFAGHELGTPDLTENWLNGYILGDKFREDDDDGEKSDSLFGAGSFHPNANGFKAYGRAVSTRLTGLGYRW